MVVYYVKKSRGRTRIGPLNFVAAEREVARYAKLGIKAQIIEEPVMLSTEEQEQSVLEAKQSALERLHTKLGWTFAPDPKETDKQRDALRTKYRSLVPA